MSHSVCLPLFWCSLLVFVTSSMGKKQHSQLSGRLRKVDREPTRRSWEEEQKVVYTKQVYKGQMPQGKLKVNGPLPADFDERFAEAVGLATKTDPADVHVIEKYRTEADIVEVIFEAIPSVLKSVDDQIADPESQLANGQMHSFLVADGSVASFSDWYETEMHHEEYQPETTSYRHTEYTLSR
eukprot:gnl/TRDRNA2_/TRDRNA2_188936_c0_seq1.p2 gnl/TRDRNA2_/TRDRNA2_188936_c0~~gnl/TRDRNA2_/TRDRNA2_188936_c0_seq1.p2  ORF type:complete len:183 (+),score=37.54 gnl/TRDRNA2_/TRDRNA2_188936_c0_seq1:72-620(+)